jgi:threonine/homoserine/homoserine lactone efflux protein
VSGGLWSSFTLIIGPSLLGLGLLFQRVGWLYGVLKLVGGTYLVYLGIRTLLSPPPVASAEPDAGPILSRWHAFRRGVLVDLSNPKAAVFFVSLFAVTMPPDAPLWFEAMIVAAVVLVAAGWYAMVACLVNLSPVAAVLQRSRAVLARVTGVVFIVLGARLAADR